MNQDSKIFVAGHRGLLGSSLVNRLRQNGYTGVITKSRGDLDLTDRRRVESFFDTERPEYVFLAAAAGGGIQANISRPAEFIHDNLAIQTSVINASQLTSARRLIFFGSACAYPEGITQPMREDYLMTGCLEPTSEYYAVAKIAGMKMCEAYNRQFGCCFLSVIPATLYGPNDNFDSESSHVLAALIAKFHRARVCDDESVVVWGSGTPRREFLYVDDLADACMFLMSMEESELRKALGETGFVVNVGTGADVTIMELASAIKGQTGYQGDILLDRSMPDGVASKMLDSSRIMNLGWSPNIALEDGIERTYSWYKRRAGAAALGSS